MANLAALQLSATELRGMTNWPPALIEEFLSISREMGRLAAATAEDVAALNASVEDLDSEKLNNVSGQVIVPLGASSIVVPLVGVAADTKILLTIASNDATMTSAQVVAGVDGFEIFPNAAPTADCLVNYLIISVGA